MSIHLGDRKQIDVFKPKIERLDPVQDEFIPNFDAGDENFSFNCFIKDEAKQCSKLGQGATYVVLNETLNINGVINKEIISYYTLTSTAIPYEDKIKLDPEESGGCGEEYDIQVCGVPAVEMKMFAVSKNYQDVFYEYEGENLPIAAWILRRIVNYANSMITSIVGFQALFLHSVPEAENFYLKNGFRLIEENMKPLYCVDYDFKPMYLALREIPI